MEFTLIVALGALGLFGGLLVLLELGGRFGARALALNADATTGASAMEGAVPEHQLVSVSLAHLLGNSRLAATVSSGR